MRVGRQPTLVMGILNVTPDSFSDGGRWCSPDAATEHGLQLVADGAAVVDVGGESTRPGAARTSPQEELSRVIPVVKSLVKAGVKVSVDTMRAEVAAQAIAAGASIINDVSGGLGDPAMFDVIAGSDVDYVIMHWRGHSEKMDRLSNYTDVVEEVSVELLGRVRAAEAAGISGERIIVDPGLGFAKNPEHNWALLSNLRNFNQFGYRQLVGASRKRFLGELTGRPALQRDPASAAISFWAARCGVWGVRTHSVSDHVDSIAVANALEGAP